MRLDAQANVLAGYRQAFFWLIVKRIAKKRISSPDQFAKQPDSLRI
jgi:hypothetical protein